MVQVALLAQVGLVGLREHAVLLEPVVRLEHQEVVGHLGHLDQAEVLVHRGRREVAELLVALAQVLFGEGSGAMELPI
jgi:hypothetical protein